MNERRKHKRVPLKLQLDITSLFKQSNIVIDKVNESIDVSDISKSGLGFTSKHDLPIGYYFDAKIQLTNEKFFYSVLKIIRSHKDNDKYFIGAEFVGLAEILNKSIDEYSQELDLK